MGELQRVLLDIAENQGLVKHFVMTSDVPGVFNFGGDLSLFVLLIRARDHESLRLYGADASTCCGGWKRLPKLASTLPFWFRVTRSAADWNR
jgi:DSF synthase